MATRSAATKTEPKPSREAQRERTRARMLQAVLDIVVERGMRAVRHRAVAERAGVSLGSTTYHFSSIEDLITSAFHYWREQKVGSVNPYYLEVKQKLAQFNGSAVPLSERPEMAAWICEQSIGYVLSQLDGKRYDRIVELAFYHESLRVRSLRDMLENIRKVELEYLANVHLIMGSDHPGEDARMTLALFRQLEQSAVMAVLPGLDTDVIRQTICRHLSLCFGVPLSPSASGR